MENFKLTTWKGQECKKQIAYKIDGVQAILSNGQVLSRAGKPLYNVDPSLLKKHRRYEIFVNDYETTMSIVRTHDHVRKISQENVYEIWPGTDERLLTEYTNVDVAYLIARERGYEGIVVDQKWKVKPQETFDVAIVSVIPGKGKHKGRMGALVTSKGKVGAGFSDSEREQTWRVGEIIEVACMSLTKNDKFRHPRFVRRRWDKEQDG